MSSRAKLVVGTRVHFERSSPGDEALVPKEIEAFYDRASVYADHVFVALQVGHERSAEVQRELEHLSKRKENLRIVPVSPWGFTFALNALVHLALTNDFEHILFQSREILVDQASVHELGSHLLDDTLVVGARLPGHHFSEGQVPLNGTTCPWNTLALWDLKKLGATGFPLVGDGGIPGLVAGVEEVSAVAVAQQFEQEKKKAKLVELSKDDASKWDTGMFDGNEERKKWHKEKMMSKLSRPEGQLRRLFGTDSARRKALEVYHIPRKVVSREHQQALRRLNQEASSAAGSLKTNTDPLKPVTDDLGLRRLGQPVFPASFEPDSVEK